MAAAEAETGHDHDHGQSGSVSFVAGPIGNLGDITARAVECLRSADLIACEDTRHSRRLLDHYDIDRCELISLHDRNEAARAPELVQRAQSGARIACISDAGMPAVSDPGYRLMRACIDAGVEIDVLPGPSAVLTALVGSGMPTDAFRFGGFLPHKSGKKETELKAAIDGTDTALFFESPHRITKTLALLKKLDPERSVCVARELTKKFQTWHRGTAAELTSEFEAKGDAKVRGEITLVIAGLSREQVRQRKKEERRKSRA
jgi:16S rRNA (cytidine1402-2'-O)-methyltransferase